MPTMLTSLELTAHELRTPSRAQLQYSMDAAGPFALLGYVAGLTADSIRKSCLCGLPVSGHASRVVPLAEGYPPCTAPRHHLLRLHPRHAL